MWETPSRGTASTRPASHAWPPRLLGPQEWGGGLWIALQAAQDRRLRKQFCHERKALAGYYQLLLGHAAAGDCLGGKIHGLPSDRCW